MHLRIATTLIDDGQVEDVPQGAGFALLISPVRELGGARAVELVLAAIAALGFVLAALLARRIVPEPYASAGAGAGRPVAARDRARGGDLPRAAGRHVVDGRRACAR